MVAQKRKGMRLITKIPAGWKIATFKSSDGNLWWVATNKEHEPRYSKVTDELPFEQWKPFSIGAPAKPKKKRHPKARSTEDMLKHMSAESQRKANER